MDRSSLIRRSLTRDLTFLVAHEMARTLEHQRQTERAYGIWAQAQGGSWSENYGGLFVDDRD